VSYNTWPVFIGRGWNIKKRPITRTIVQQADSGAEYRIGRYQNPLYEFDIEIPYLSAADYATLQSFFNQQFGPLIPFYFTPDNDPGGPYLVRFKDDQIEVTQTMNAIYVATTITLRSVR
jgi:hypothetical protein